MNARAKPAARTLRCPCVVGRGIPLPDCADCQGTGRLVVDEADPAPSAATIPNFFSLYRAHVGSDDYRRPERTVFVRAGSEREALTKIAGALAAIEQRPVTEIEESLYNCRSARECVEMGVSADLELRLFEVGWGTQTLFVEEPIFLVDHPAAMWRKWMETQEVSTRKKA